MKKKLPGRKRPTFPWTFLDGPLHISCLCWEVNTHMSGQSNDCLRVCNVKMKKILQGRNGAHFHAYMGYRVTKKINWHNEVHTYWRQFWRQIWRSPKLFKNTFYTHFEGFWWPSYVTSKIDINMCEPHYVNLFFFVNLLHSLCVWFFDIWHLFDNLTSFWHFDIFFTIF